MEIRTDRVGMLLDQLQTSCDIARTRFEGLTDDEYLWEPVPGGWSLRRRADTTTTAAYGAGEWVLDRQFPEPDPAPIATIAWRLAHLYAGYSMRWDWTFGSKKMSWDEIAFTPSAAEALSRLWALMERWRASIAAMTEEQLDTVGLGQFPDGLDRHVPFIGIIWWTNRELIHHTAEIALLRDLWRARDGGLLRV